MRFNLDLKDIKYVKVLYNDEFGDMVTIKAALKNITEREITICSKFEDGCNIVYPQTVILSIVCSDGLYKTKAKLKKIENDEPYSFFYLETPDGVEYQQNREYFRIRETRPCTYLVEKDYDEISLEGETFDISANGISIILPTLVVSETPAQLKISMPEKEITTKVNYVRSEKLDKGYKISFSYLNMSNPDKDYISQVCIKKQLEQKRSIYY